jgi:hypothetical protein
MSVAYKIVSLDINKKESMKLFWKYFFQGFGYYFKPSNCLNDFMSDKFQFDFSKVTSDFNIVYNKMKETKK